MKRRPPESRRDLLEAILDELIGDDAESAAFEIYRHLGVRVTAEDVARKPLHTLAARIEPRLPRVKGTTIVDVFALIRVFQNDYLGHLRENVRWTSLWIVLEEDADMDDFGPEMTKTLCEQNDLPFEQDENIFDKLTTVADTCRIIWERLGGEPTWNEKPYEQHFCATQSMFLDLRRSIARCAIESPKLRDAFFRDGLRPSDSVHKLFGGNQTFLCFEIERLFGVCFGKPRKPVVRSFGYVVTIGLWLWLVSMVAIVVGMSLSIPIITAAACLVMIAWKILEVVCATRVSNSKNLPADIHTYRDLVLEIRDRRAAFELTHLPRVRPAIDVTLQGDLVRRKKSAAPLAWFNTPIGDLWRGSAN